MPSISDLLEGKEESTEAKSFTVLANPQDFPKTPYDDLMGSASEEHGVPYEVLYRNLKQESKFDPKAISWRTDEKTGKKVPNARGIAQFIPSTAKMMGVTDPHDPKQAIPASAKYLKQLYDQFGDWKLAVAAYNAGPGTVRKAGNKIPDIEETRNHVKAVFPGDDREPSSFSDKKDESVATSFSDLVNQKEAEVLEAPRMQLPTPAEVPVESNPRKFYTTRGITPFVMGKMGFGPKPEGGWDDAGRALDAEGKAYDEQSGVSNSIIGDGIAQTLKGLTGFAKQPMEVVKGVFDFALSLPAFGVGMLGATGRGTQELVGQLAYGDLDLDKIYTASSKGMEESFKFFEPGKEMVLGKPSEVSQMVGQVAMAPLNALSVGAQAIAQHEGFKDYPNVRGAIKFAGDGLGLVTMGLILHGPSARADFSKGVEEITREAGDIQTRELQLDQSMDSVVKNVQKKQLEIDKQRLESKAAEFSKKFQGNLEMIEEAGRQAEQIAKEKIRPVQEARPEMAEGYEYKPVKLTKKEAEKAAKKGLNTVEELQAEVDKNPELKGNIRVDALGEKDSSIKPGTVQVTVIRKGRETTLTAKNNVEDIASKYKEKMVEYDKGESETVKKFNGLNNENIRKLPKDQGFEVLDPNTGEVLVRFENEKDARNYYDNNVKKEPSKFIAAIKAEDGTIATSRYHFQAYSELKRADADLSNMTEGWLVDGKFYNRNEFRELTGGLDQEALKEGKITSDKFILDVEKAKKTEVFNEDLSPEAKRALDKMIEEDTFNEPSSGIGKSNPTNKRTLSVKEAKTELDPVYDLIGKNKYKNKRNVNIEEHNLQPGEPAEIHPTWHDGVYRFTILRDANGNLTEGRSGSYDSIMMPGQVAGAKSGPLQPGTTLYIVDAGPYPNQISGVKIYRTAPITKELPTGKGIQKQLPNLPKEPLPAKVTEVKTIESEPITEVDKATIPEDGQPSGAFRTSPEKTKSLAQVFAEKGDKVMEDPEVFLQKLINDANRWADGESIPIATVRDAMSDMATRGNELRDFFVTGSDHMNFIEVASEAAKWARGLKRGGSGVQLNMMIPLDKFPPMVKQWLYKMSGGDINKISLNKVYRNTKLFNDTGFWLGKDNKFRYEIDDSKASYFIPKAYRENYIGAGFTIDNITTFMDYPELYKAIPEIKNILVKFDKDLDVLGRYDSSKRLIEVKKLGDKETFIHELQHAVNEISGSKFIGTNESAAGSLKSYFRDPGEMEARLAAERRNMTHAFRISEPPWVTLDDMLAKEGIENSAGNKLYSGLPVDEISKTFVKAYHWSKGKLSKDFDFGRLGESTSEINASAVESAKLGAWFTASDKPISDTAKVKNEVVLKLKNPLMLTNDSVPEVDVVGRKIKDAKQWLMDEVERAGGGEKLRNELKDKGYDGIVLEDSEFDNAKSYVVFDKGQVITDAGSVKLYSGVPLDEAAKMIVAGARKVSEYTKHARGLKEFDLRSAARMVRGELNRAFIDRSGNIRKDLLENLGDEGYRIVQKMYLAKGSSSVAANALKQMRKEVYDGLGRGEKKILDDIILDDRMIDIGKYKSEGEFNFPGGLKLRDFIAHRELFPQLEKLSPERAIEIDRRAKAYFEWMKKPLKDMLDNGLISQEEFNNLSSHNYRRIKLVDIYDKRNTAKVGKKTRTVYDSGVESLARGRDTDIYEPSSEIMALEVFNRSYGRILNNEANKALIDLARNDPSNDFVRIKQKGTDSEKIPEGWHRIFAYEDGQRKSIYISPEMGKEWITSSPEMSYRMSQFLRYASGSPVLRTMATGINWGFALANMPRDIMHLWFTARTFENGKWTPLYNPNAPLFALQLGRDLGAVFTDAMLKKGRYQDYINEGGGMEFLVHQGRLFQRGRHLEGGFDKVMDFMGYLGETSEVLTRLAIRERALRKGKSPQEATFAARDYMDFGQGGGISKALDNAFPYLNASIQGTRGMFRAFKPGSGSALSSTYKLTQFAAATVGVYLASQAMAPKSHEALKNNIDSQNNLVIPLGDAFGFEDDKGQMRYPYIKIPLDPSQKFFKKFFEASTDKMMGNEVDVDGTVNALESVSPVGISSLPPTLSSTLGYITNKNFWLNDDIWKQTKPFSYPKSKEEFTSRTPQGFVDVGQATGLSPERTKYAVNQLFASGTIFSYLLGEGYDKAFGDMTKQNKEEHLAQTLVKIPGVNRFFGITNPYSQFAGKIDKAEEKATISRFTQNRGMDTLVEAYLYNKNVDAKEIFKYAESFKDMDTYDRLIDRFKFEQAIKTLPNKAFWRRMKGLPTEAKAEVFVDRLGRANEEERKQLWKEYSIVDSAKGVLGEGFRNEVMKQMGNK